MRIKEVCQLTDLKDSTIRYYEKEKLLTDVERSNNGYRKYSEKDVELLEFIKKARNLGFRLDEIRDIIRLKESGDSTCHYVTSHMREKIENIDREINRLRRERERLLVHLSEGDLVDGCQGEFCHYIEGVEK